MSFRARRIVAGGAQVSAFSWDGVHHPQTGFVDTPPQQEIDVLPKADLAALERDAFAKGYEQGERSGAEAAGKRGEAMLRRLADTLNELTTVRAQMIQQTERQIVELALAVARRVVHREVALDPDLLIAISRVALERLGESAQVSVKLHPDEFQAISAARVAEAAATNVKIVADPRVARGGCRVESEMGMLDAGVDAQIQEIARALLGEEQVANGVRVG
jgi:flagellar assembly protein FliH